MIRNRRKHERTPAPENRCRITIGTGSTDGEVVDFSPEGLRLGGFGVLILFVDQQVIVEYKGQTIVGRCRTVTRAQDGTFQVGLLQEPDDFQHDSDSILINSFVQSDGQKVVCIPTAIEDKTAQVRLLNDKEFSVDIDDIVQTTRQERLEELCNSEQLNKVLPAYGLPVTGNEFADRATVLNQEFGPAVGAYSQ